jgi:hypothetical protein
MDITILNDLIVKDRVKLNLHCDLKLNSIKFIKASFEERCPKLTRQKAIFITFYEPDNGIFKKLNSYVLCKEYIKTWLKNIDEKTIEEIKSDIIFLKKFIRDNISNWLNSFYIFPCSSNDDYESEAEVLYIIRYLSSDMVSEKLDKAIGSLIKDEKFMLSYYKTNSFYLNNYKTSTQENILHKFLEDIDIVAKVEL